MTPELVLQAYGQGYGQMQYPYGQAAQYGQQPDASVTGQPQQGLPGTAPAQYAAQQQMPYGQMRELLCTFHIKRAALSIILHVCLKYIIKTCC